MNIGMLLNAPYPSDVRVKKEADALIQAGFKVHLLCLRKEKEAQTEVVDGINITRIDAGKNDYELAFWDVIMSATFQHPRFKKAIPVWVAQHSIKLLHVHDLPLAGTALALRKKLNIPVVSDFHENFPDALKAWFEWKKNPIARLKNKLFMNPTVWTNHERQATLQSDHVIAVVDEMKQRLIKDYGAASEKITVVTNTEERSFLQQPEDPTTYQAYEGKFIITYSGNIGPHRGVDTAIEAMRYLNDYPNIILVIVGSGSKPIMDNLNQKVVESNLSDRVFFLGRQPFSRFYSFMKFTYANIIPHKSNGHTDNTIPHKLFQAMMVGKPLIVSSSAPLKRIVSTVNSGVIFEAGNAEDLSKKIVDLYKDESLQRLYGENGMKATLQSTMNWEHDQKNLIRVYRSLLQVSSPQSSNS